MLSEPPVSVSVLGGTGSLRHTSSTTTTMGSWAPATLASISVSVVIPALNEAASLGRLLPTIPAWVHEVILVDGQSADATIEIARATCPAIRVIQQPGSGKGDALRAGLNAARGDVIVMLDADGSMAAEELESFVRMLLSGFDFVKGSRFMSGGHSADLTPIRRLGNRALSAFARWLLGSTYTDLCYGYAALWKRTLPAFQLDEEPAHIGFEIEALMGARALAQGLHGGEVPCREAARMHGVSHLVPVRDGWRSLARIVAEWSTRRRRSPFLATFERHPAIQQSRDSMSAVVCTQSIHRWDHLVRAVTSLHAQHTPPAEIIVIVDHNPDLLARAASLLTTVTVTANRESAGIAGARNTAVKVARGRIVAFLDDDAAAVPEWSEQILACYRDPRVIAVGGSIVPRWQAGRPRWFPREFDWVVGCSYRGMPTSLSMVRNLIGCNMSFDREAFEVTGDFRGTLGRQPHGYPAGCEETELCIRLQQLLPQRTIVFQPAAKVLHFVPVERGRWSYFRRRCLAEGRSKAQLSSLVGRTSSLASEWSYVWRTLPTGVLKEIGATIGADFSGAVRAMAILAGFAVTLQGYLTGAFWYNRPPRRQAISRRAVVPVIQRID